MSRQGAHLSSTRPNLRSRTRAGRAALGTAAGSIGALPASRAGAPGAAAGAAGAPFELLSPGRQPSISYRPEERTEVATLPGGSLVEEGGQIKLEDDAGKAA